jgi:hypothetical protein
VGHHSIILWSLTASFLTPLNLFLYKLWGLNFGIGSAVPAVLVIAYLIWVLFFFTSRSSFWAASGLLTSALLGTVGFVQPALATLPPTYATQLHALLSLFLTFNCWAYGFALITPLDLPPIVELWATPSTLKTPYRLFVSNGMALDSYKLSATGRPMC